MRLALGRSTAPSCCRPTKKSLLFSDRRAAMSHGMACKRNHTRQRHILSEGVAACDRVGRGEDGLSDFTPPTSHQLQGPTKEKANAFVFNPHMLLGDHSCRRRARGGDRLEKGR